MNDSRIAARYARALFLLAQDRNLTDKVREDLLHLAVLRDKSPEFRLLLESPVLLVSEKIRFFRTALKGSVEELSLEFLCLLVDHRREFFLPSVIRMFMEQFKSSRGILEAKVISAIPMEAELVSDLKKRLTEYSRANIEMTQETREELIGGFILRLEDQQLDASVLSQLRKIRQELRESQK